MRERDGGRGEPRLLEGETITGYLVDLRRQYADRTDHLGLVHTVLESLGHHQGRAVEPGSEREPDGPC